MATSTTNYALTKPDDEEFVNIDLLNSNSDIIDTQLKRVDNACLGNEVSRWNRIISAAGTAGVVYNNVGATETTLTELSVEGINVKNGSIYHFLANIFVNATTAGEDFFFRLRKDTPLTGTVLFTWPFFVKANNLDDAVPLFGSWVATANDVDGDFYLSVQRAVGAGTIDIYGNKASMLHMWTDPPTTTQTSSS